MKSKLCKIGLSIAAAFILWLFVISTVSPGSRQTYYNIPVNLANESVMSERGLMITSQSATSVTMELSGNRSDLSKVDSNTITLKADLSNIYEPGTHSLTYTTTFPGNVASNAFVVESKSPGRITVNVERRISKPITVEVRWNGSAPEGFIADRENKILEYPVVQITGPQSVTDKIERAIIDVDLNEQRESISADYLFTLCDESGEPVDAELIVTNVETIHLDVKIYRVKDISLTYQLLEGGGAKAADVDISLSVDTIRVAGSETAIDQLGDFLILGTINLAEITESTEKVFPITLDESITNLTGVSEVTAVITVKNLATKDFLIQKIEAINVPENLQVEIFTKELTLTARGPISQIGRLNVEDIRVTVDFTHAEIGTSTFGALVTYAPGFGEIGTIRIDSVSASVTAAVAEGDTKAAETNTASEIPASTR